MTTTVVRVEGVFKDYMLGEQKVQALRNINLTIDDGVFLAIAGPSGSGSFTLLNMIGCIDTPSSGHQHDRSGHSQARRPISSRISSCARTIGFIFQTFKCAARFLRLPRMSEYPILQLRDVSRAERRERVDYFLNISNT